jgi:PAS domain S-box-containing protein
MAVKRMDIRPYRGILDYLIGVFDSFPAALVSLDTSLRIIMFNRAAEELTGFAASEVTGRRVTAIIRLGRLRYVTRILRKEGTFPADGFITKLRVRDAAEVPVRLVLSPLGPSRGTLAGILCVASDLKQVKRFQGKLLEAERLSALSEIAAGLNHAINNPLCAILGNTQLLLMDRERLDPAAIRKLRSIEREISRIKKIAEHLPGITRPRVKDYVGGRRMLDLDGVGRPETRRRPPKQ